MVTRVVVHNKYSVKPIYTVFKWNLCAACNQEFRRERGVMFIWFHTKELYMCTTCSCGGSVDYSNKYIEYRFSRLGAEPPNSL